MPSQTWKKMENLVGESKGTRFIGIANHSPAMLESLIKSAKIHPRFHQFEGHPYLRQDKFIETNFKYNITVTNYAPLGNTSPTYATTGASAPKLLTNKVITDIAKERNCAPAQVVLAWNLWRNVIIVPKAIKKAHQIENFETEKCALKEEDIAKIQGMKYNIRMLSYPCALAANACFAGLS
jgi:alcohol dehydrogenase (NADP+)